MPHVEFHLSNDLAIDGSAVLREVEQVLLRHDPAAGESKGRCYNVDHHHHTHCLLRVSMLPKPHRDAAFAKAVVADLEHVLAAALPEGAFYSVDLNFSGEFYLTKRHRAAELFVAPDMPFTEDGGRSFTLPARYYTDGTIHRSEKSKIFDVSWVYVGHRSQLCEEGQYLTATVYDQEVFVVREGETLNGFYNVCRHRGHHIVEGTGKGRALTCPYHGWVYGLDGGLRNARNSQNVEGFDACDFSLAPIQVEELCGLVFVNLDPSARSLREQTPGLEDGIRHYCPDVDQLEFAQRDTFEVDANWKTLIDNFLECYHCATAHRDFVNLVDMDSYRTTVHGIYSSQLSDGVGNTESSAYQFDQGEVDFSYAGWFLWPNLSIWVYPGDANLSILQMQPTAPERSIEYQDWFCLGGTPTKQLQDAMDYQKDVLQPEDIGLCESVQKGLRSNAYNQGRFIIDRGRTELSEHAVHHFQTLVANALGHTVET